MQRLFTRAVPHTQVRSETREYEPLLKRADNWISSRHRGVCEWKIQRAAAEEEMGSKQKQQRKHTSPHPKSSQSGQCAQREPEAQTNECEERVIKKSRRAVSRVGQEEKGGKGSTPQKTDASMCTCVRVCVCVLIRHVTKCKRTFTQRHRRIGKPPQNYASSKRVRGREGEYTRARVCGEGG